MISILFIFLGILFLIELTTPIARLSGINIGEISSGLQVQSSIGILSRVLNSFFMPLLGYLSDIQGFKNLSQLNFILMVVISGLIMILFFPLMNFIYSIYCSFCKSIFIEGTIFKFQKYFIKESITYNLHWPLSRFRFLRFFTIASFIPLYLSWPLVFMFIKNFPEYRGLILGATSLINGLNSLALVFFIDPFLIRISKYKQLSNTLFKEQTILRFISYFIATILLIFFSFFL